MKEERYWKISLLNKWFAISSIIFFLAMVWLFIEDNDDEFKEYQKVFRKLEIRKSEEKLTSALADVESERVVYEKRFNTAQTELEARKSELEDAQKQLKQQQGQFYKANMDYLQQKAEVEAAVYLYENEKVHSHHDDQFELKYETKYHEALEKLHQFKLIMEDAESEMLSTELRIKDLNRNVKKAHEELNRILRNVNILDRQLATLDRQRMTFSNKIADVVRDLPIIDFMDPYYKINQIVLSDIKYNVNFALVPTVDRCTSCHLGIDKPDWVDAEQPFTAHPNLDLYLSSASPHPFEEFGCTGCHAGRGRGTSFITTAHMPNSTEEEQRWKEEYDWEPMHNWEKPMFPGKYIEASCFKCHQHEAYIAGADKLTMGLTLIEKSGCNGCHLIKRYEERRKAGPDLTRINEKTSKIWTAKWIKNPRSFRFNTRMPAFFGQENNSDHEAVLRNTTEVSAMTEYLFKNGEQLSRKNEHLYLGDPDNGKHLFDAVGCRGCHIVEPDPEKVNDETTLIELLRQHGPNLINLGSKTSAEWVYKWIKDPLQYWSETRMPNLRLTDQEARDITAYLMSFTNPEFEALEPIVTDTDELDKIAMGWLLKMNSEKTARKKLSAMAQSDKIDYVAEKSFRYYGCFGCHNISGYENTKPIGTELTYEGSKPVHRLDFGYIHDLEHTNYAWFTQKLANPRIFDRGKIIPPEDKLRMPNFYFMPEEIEALVTAILSFSDDEVGSKKLASNIVKSELVYEGRKLIKEYNCQGCHIIDGFGGQIGDVIGSLEFSPPNLNTEGAKTQPAWLFQFFKKPLVIRPNLQVRMPNYPLSDEEWNAIIKSFQYKDDEINAFESTIKVDKNTIKYRAGEKLQELGVCNNCHFYGTSYPKQGAQTWAPNLAMVKVRLQPDWVVEWLRDPQKIMPGSKMPAPFLPSSEDLSDPDAPNTWGKHLILLEGNEEAMLEGLRDYVYTVPGKIDITKEVKAYFKEHGYDLGTETEEEEEDEWEW